MADAGLVPEANLTDMASRHWQGRLRPGQDHGAKGAISIDTYGVRQDRERLNAFNRREAQHSREQHCDPSRLQSQHQARAQATSLLVKTIEAEPALAERLKIKPLEMASAAIVKITSESLDDVPLARHCDLVFLKEGLQNMVAMIVVPKTACIGIVASQIAAHYYSINMRVQRTTWKEAWATRAEAWMKEVAATCSRRATRTSSRCPTSAAWIAIKTR